MHRHTVTVDSSLEMREHMRGIECQHIPGEMDRRRAEYPTPQPVSALCDLGNLEVYDLLVTAAIRQQKISIAIQAKAITDESIIPFGPNHTGFNTKVINITVTIKI